MNHFAVQKALKEIATEERALQTRRFFKTGPGQYSEKDQFIGVRNPDCRKIARQFHLLSFPDLEKLLSSPIHEERFTALVILVNRYQKSDAERQTEIFDFYLSQTAGINNWDLVDVSAAQIVGHHLFKKGDERLFTLTDSENLWERRIAIVAIHYHIKQDELHIPLKIIDKLRLDSHDLIHKAAGWMLREIGKRDRAFLENALEERAPLLPRTTLRYAIEHFSKEERMYFMRLERPLYAK